MADPQLDHKQSVKKGELAAAPFVFWVPYADDGSTLPPVLPPPQEIPILGLYPNGRDRTLISTPYHESMWASVLGLQASKFAAAGWELDGTAPRKKAMAQEWLLNASTGIVGGWVPFASAGVSSIGNTGKWFFEVERYTRSQSSRVKALHHLDPGRCWMTTDPERPVLYIDRLGRVHELRRHQVVVILDMPDTTEQAINSPMSCAVRAYASILQLAALSRFIYEKVSGRRPLAINFVQGLAQGTLNAAIKKADDEADQKGVTSYMGAIMAGIMGDTPVNLVTINLAEIPDGVDVDKIRRYAHLEYANALGEDPAGIDPQLIGNRQLGAGTQAMVLDQKSRRGGLVVLLRQQFTHEVNKLLKDDKIQFSFSENDLQDAKAKADASKTRAETRQIQVATQEITPQQATNLAVDAGDVPKEFLTTPDQTDQATLQDTDQASLDLEIVDDASDPSNDEAQDIDRLIAEAGDDEDEKEEPEMKAKKGAAALVKENLDEAQKKYREMSRERAG